MVLLRTTSLSWPELIPTNGPSAFAQLMVKDFPLETTQKSLHCSQPGHCQLFNNNHLVFLFSKPFTYALSVDELGSEGVSEFMGAEPSGRFYNDIALDCNGQPHNPMINSGAIMSAALLLYMVKPELTISEKFEFVLSFFQHMTGGQSVGFNNSVFLSERENADRNQALAYFMREQGCFPRYIEFTLNIV